MKYSLLFLPLLFLLVACGTLKTTSLFEEPNANLRDYGALEIRDFESTIPDFSRDSLTDIPKFVAEGSQNFHFEKVKHGVINGHDEADTLVMLGEITNYQSGSDIKFESGAIKFGEVKLKIKIAIVEKNTGVEVARGEVASFSSFGFSPNDKFHRSVADEIIKFLAQNT